MIDYISDKSASEAAREFASAEIRKNTHEYAKGGTPVSSTSAVYEEIEFNVLPRRQEAEVRRMKKLEKMWE